MIGATAEQMAIMGYCWTHGFCHNPAHTSASCTYPAEGHQPTAVARNRMSSNEECYQPNRSRRPPPPLILGDA